MLLFISIKQAKISGHAYFIKSISFQIIIKSANIYICIINQNRCIILTHIIMAMAIVTKDKVTGIMQDVRMDTKKTKSTHRSTSSNLIN